MAAVPSIGRASLVESPGVAPQAAATQGLYERHAAKIQSYCHHQLGSREEAEDAVQTTFMNAFRALGRGVVPEAESAWLFKIAENVCLSRRRSSWRRGRIESPNDFEVIEELVPGPSRQHDELIGIEDALASMPEQQRRAILLREWQGLSYREVAEELEITQSAVETLIFRARRSLAQGLEQPDSIKPKRKSFRRALHTLDISAAIGALKTLLAGSAAVKATAAAVAVTAAAGTAATVTPKIEGMLPHAPKAKPTLVAPSASRSSGASTPGSSAVVAGGDRSASHALVLASAPAAATAADRSAKPAGDGKVGAVKQRKRSAPAGSTGPSVERTFAPLGAPPQTPVAETPATPAAGVEPVPAPAEPRTPEEPRRAEPTRDEPKRAEPKGGEAKREESKRDEPKREEPKAEPKHGRAQPNADEGGKSDEGKTNEGEKSRSQKSRGKDNGKREEARAPQAVVSAPESAVPSVPEVTKEVQGGGGEGEKSERGEKSDRSGKNERKDSTPAPAPAPVAGAPAVVVEPPATAPAPEPAAEHKERERGSDRGDNGSGRRKGK